MPWITRSYDRGNEVEKVKALTTRALGPMPVHPSIQTLDIPSPGRAKRQAVVDFFFGGDKTQCGGVSSEPDCYLMEPELPHLVEGHYSDPLLWWKEHEQSYPQLARLAKRYLPLMASSSPVERVFSKSGWFVSKKRCTTTDDTVSLLTFFLSSNLNQQYLPTWNK